MRWQIKQTESIKIKPRSKMDNLKRNDQNFHADGLNLSSFYYSLLRFSGESRFGDEDSFATILRSSFEIGPNRSLIRFRVKERYEETSK